MSVGAASSGLLQVLSFLFAFAVGGLGFDLCVFVVGWGHAFQSEWLLLIYYNSVVMPLKACRPPPLHVDGWGHARPQRPRAPATDGPPPRLTDRDRELWRGVASRC